VYVAGGLALVGTTITGYEYVWESIEVAAAGAGTPLTRLHRDAVLGVLIAGAGFLFVLVATSATLGMHHLQIETAADAARALEPLAGPWAAIVFGIGLFGSAALTVPILASSTGYVFAHTFGWEGSLDSSISQARPFYAVILIVMIVATVGSLLGLPPIRLLFWASIAGGLGTPITLVLMNAAARSSATMNAHRISLPLSIAGWTVTALVVVACGAFLLSIFNR
jgi:Mn2+/Fe2+ NRAMP family transporter